MNDNSSPTHLADCEAAAAEIAGTLYPAAERVSDRHGARMTVAGLIATAGQIAAAKGIPPGVFLEVAFASLNKMVEFHEPPMKGPMN